MADGEHGAAAGMERPTELWGGQLIGRAPLSRRERWWRSVRETPCAVLLAVQLLGVLVYPFLADASVGQWQGFGRSMLGLFGLAVLFLAVWAVRNTPALTWVAILLGLPVVFFTILEGFVPDNEQVTLWSSVLHALFYLYTAYGLIRYMFNDNWVTRDELFATGAAFTVVAWGFAYIYAVIQIIWPQSFSAYENAEQPRTWLELLFMSFTTLTSVGLSDIGPIRPHARSVIMIEQVGGVMYVALVISRLVGLTIARFRR